MIHGLSRAFLVVTLLALVPRAQAADAAAGKRVYDANCTACHGAAGDGNGPAAVALTPKPRNFTDKAWWDKTSQKAVTDAITGGRPGTSMTPFASLSPADLDNVYAYIRGFAPM